jgi:hypothetical protein
MQYRLRTLLIVLALGPPLLAGVWPTVRETLWPPPKTLLTMPRVQFTPSPSIIDLTNLPDPIAPPTPK